MITKTISVFGATGIVGIELTASLLRSGERVFAIVRDKKKLCKMLNERGSILEESTLTVIETDLFSESIMQKTKIVNAIKKSDYVFNCASPKISCLPFSKINRKWGAPVSTLTKELVSIGNEVENTPHIVAFCGPEYFKKYDSTKGILGGFFTAVLKSVIGALRDNYIEANYLLNSDYQKWTVLRCGSIRGWTGMIGDSSKIDIDFHKDKSDYRNGKGKSLLIEDLVMFLADKIKSEEFNRFVGEMPFVYNVEF